MTDLTINEVSIEPLPNEDGLIGFANIVINNDFKICNLALHTCPSHPTGIRLVFPVKDHNGVRIRTVFPINQASYEVCVVAVANAYRELMERLR